MRQLLYPRYFYSFILEDSKKYGADPTLVLSIMREESRFNPRAKSEAAARGLLQFIITTARDIGRDVGLVDVAPEDLYDPRVIIRLGAKYVSELSKQFGGDRYMAAAAYNAGPKQVALWSRLAPAAGDDWFLSSDQLRRDEGLRPQSDEQLPALRGDLRQRRPAGWIESGSLTRCARRGGIEAVAFQTPFCARPTLGMTW